MFRTPVRALLLSFRFLLEVALRMQDNNPLLVSKANIQLPTGRHYRRDRMTR
jgi:hypothetical protein